MPDNGNGYDSLYEYLRKHAPEFLAALTPDAIQKLKNTTAAEGKGLNLAMHGMAIAGKGGPNIPGIGPQVRVINPPKKFATRPSFAPSIMGPTWVHEAMHQLFTKNIPTLSQYWGGIGSERQEQLRGMYEQGQRTSWGFGGKIFEFMPTIVESLAASKYDPSGLSDYEKSLLGDIFTPEALAGTSQVAQPAPITSGVATPAQPLMTGYHAIEAAKMGPKPQPAATTPPATFQQAFAPYISSTPTPTVTTAPKPTNLFRRKTSRSVRGRTTRR